MAESGHNYTISGGRARELAEIKKKEGFFRRIVRGLTKTPARAGATAVVTAGVVAGGVAAEATTHPIQTVAENVASVVTDQAEGSRRAGETLVSFHDENAEAQAYAEKIAAKLNGTVPLDPGEQLFERVKVIPAGANFEERQKMQQEGTPVNVRNYPGTNTPTGQLSLIIGKLSQGTIIEHAILVTGGKPHPASANDTGKWYGFVYGEPNSDRNQPGRIGFFYDIYGETQNSTSTASVPTSE